jgi:D-arabinan exo alpha-(1,3)/(1,5)-arabinofuranosidase (non-reducing end)
MQRRFACALAVLLLAPELSPVRAAEKVDLKNLLPQMTDLSLLAEYPDPPYVAKQFSSYDRASEAPGSESWFANGDRGFMLYDGVLKEETPYFKHGPKQGNPDGHFAAGSRVGISPTHRPVGGFVWAYVTAPDGSAEGGKVPQGYVAQSAIALDPQGHVLAEMDGPGSVVNIWSANPKDGGKIRIYLDGAEKPVIEGSLEALLGGKWKTTIDGNETTPFPDPLSCERSRGFNLYFPIAYARHCKITVDRKDIYYHVDYRTYQAGTEVETFKLEDMERLSQEVHGVVEGLRLKNHRTPAEKLLYRDVQSLSPGDSARLEFEGSQAIKFFSAKLQGDQGPAPAEAWRSLLLTITFDGASHPQICCPLGDFFGSSPGLQPYVSLPFDVDRPAEMRSWWCMPFEKSAVIEVQNLGKKATPVFFQAQVGKYTWTERSMHFHAKWRQQTLNTRPFRDWTYCDLKGQGVFVGDMLSLTNPSTAWWGEGDEKIYVDGERFPSWFGTGSEDYYGYAWSNPTPFQHAYHNQTRCDGPGNRGRTSVNRFHIIDAIPFTKSFHFDIEVWHWTPKIDISYAATSYWYAQPGATDDFKKLETVALDTLPPLPGPQHIKGALEGEKLRIVGKSSDFDVSPQEMTAFGDGNWSGESHLWGRPSKAGEWADLALPVHANGRYHVFVYLTKARDYGIVRFNLDGKPLGKAIDCFHPNNVVSTGAIDLGTVDLKKGTSELRVGVVGTNPKSDGLRYMWGLDCVVLKPASHHDSGT